MKIAVNTPSPYILLFVLLALVGVAARFFGLESIPPGIFVDEQAGIANTLCLLRDGTSLYGQPRPLYFPALGGFYDPIFIYTQALMVKLFGESLTVFRIFPAVCLLSACFGTAALAWLFVGFEGAILALVTSLFCPWSFHAGRLVWGSGLITAFFPWGLFFLFLTKKSEDSPRRAFSLAVLGGVFLACAVSLYRPANAVVLLLLTSLFVLRFPTLRIRYRYLFTAILVLVICGIPNILFMMGNGWNRVDSLSIFGKDHMLKLDGSYVAAVGEMLENYRLLLSWKFLFVSGDAIYRHTPAWGALGWPECCGLFCLTIFLLSDLMPRREKRFFEVREHDFILFCALAVLIGLFPAAQSWDSNPHALRANAAWPFFVILSSAGLAKVYQKLEIGPIAVSLTFLLFIPIFLSHYFLVFPALAEPWFDPELTRTAKVASTTGDWSEFGVAIKEYGRDGPSVFPMVYKGMSCRDAIDFIDNLKNPKATPVPRITIQFGTPKPPSHGELSTLLAPKP